MYAFYFNVWVDVIDLCGEVVEVVCLWDLVCEKLPTLFSRDRGEYKIYSKRCFSDQSDCSTDFCKQLFNYLPNQ